MEITPKLQNKLSISEGYKKFITKLSEKSFSGDICSDYATRMSVSTDNSIYQLIPEAVLFPKTHDDIVAVFKLAGEEQFRDIRISPRAGGTGTDGQSLTAGIICDCSRYMRNILDLDLENQTVTVQPGVILDQLNAFLKPHGFFFAPSLSPSNRACLGGMFNTDACGLGSAQYGRTSEHVLSVKAVLVGGDEVQTEPMDEAALATFTAQSSPLSELSQKVNSLLEQKADLIEQQFPKMLRFMTGYNLAHTRRDGYFDLTKLLSGSEGSLAYISELKLNILPIPTVKTMIIVKYRSFDTALREGFKWLDFKPTCIESIDDKIITLARGDEIWLRVKPMMEADGPDSETQAINILEWRDYDRATIDQKIAQVINALNNDPNIVGFYQTENENEIAAWWELRKKSVGLLANLPGKRQPVPFVEDTAVPPENIADFIAEFSAMLDEHELTYGIFGHLDAGCMHVRPALDMTDPEDAKLIKIITDKAHALSLKYKGTLWGEHGSGFRCEYIEEYFGCELYQDLRTIKALFDPHNQLNPGKVVTAAGTELETVKAGVKLRADHDGKVPTEVRENLFKAFKCNGNAICMNYLPDIAICPSYKVTRDRIHSPKGRAVLLREWLYQLTESGFGFKESGMKGSEKPDQQDFSHQVYQAFSGCLGCKSCALSCPVQVDIPSLKAKFLSLYHRRYKRTVRDRLIINSEKHLEKQSKQPWLYNALKPLTTLFLSSVGLVDLPSVDKKPLHKRLNQSEFSLVDEHFKPTKKSVLLLQDALTSFVEPKLVMATCQLLQNLGYEPAVLPFKENGKAKQNKGVLAEFSALAKSNNEFYAQFSDVPMLGIEPSLILAYRDEYQQTLGAELGFSVKLLSEWLVAQDFSAQASTRNTFYLLAHCTERALSPKSESYWKEIFTRFGQELIVIQTGCCGMAGSYGHEKEHVKPSKALFSMSWEKQIEKLDLQAGQLLATGYSCRSQVKRCSQWQATHPIEALLNAIS